VALYHGLPSLGLPPGSTILVPNYHQGVEIDALLAAGHPVRYYRLNDQLRIDFADADRRVDGSVSAFYVIHYFGFAQPLEPIRAFCAFHGLRLIEDCALSLFARDGDMWLGSAGDLALFSVYKTLPLPHGGFLVTKRTHEGLPVIRAPWRSTAAQTLDLVQHAMRAGDWERVERWARRSTNWLFRLLPANGGGNGNGHGPVTAGGAGWDPRLLRYGASPWVTWLMRFMDRDAVIARRRANFRRLSSHLHAIVPAAFRDLPRGACPLFLPVFVRNKPWVARELEHLGVQSVNLWDAPHATCPVELAEEVAEWRESCLELPIHQELGEADMDRIAQAVLTVLTRCD
jgi:dTDP-4-amino-4,6-dideoxygalactose transaminase